MDTFEQKRMMHPVTFFEEIAAAMPHVQAMNLRQIGDILSQDHLFETMQSAWEGTDTNDWQRIMNATGGKIEWVAGIARRLGKAIEASTPRTGGAPGDRQQAPQAAPGSSFRQPMFIEIGAPHITLGRKLVAQNALHKVEIPRGIARGISGVDGVLIQNCTVYGLGTAGVNLG